METKRVCSVPGCERPHLSRGVCNNHYAVMKRAGTLPPKYKRPTCSIADCDRPHSQHGLCNMHALRLRTRGTTDPPKQRPTAEERFWAKVKTGGPDDCWEWVGKDRLPTGHGMFWNGKQKVGCHRWVYEQMVGPIPEGLTIDHQCNHGWCVNPAHLKPMTLRENILRSSSPAALNARKTHCPRGHPYDEANTVIRKGKRYCLTCQPNVTPC